MGGLLCLKFILNINRPAINRKPLKNRRWVPKGTTQQVLLGATGTGKTFTMCNVIARLNKPTLVLAHNKTLAGQLYNEIKSIFPKIM